jgi:outer membrane protein TolC
MPIRLLTFGLVTALAGCASVVPDGGIQALQKRSAGKIVGLSAEADSPWLARAGVDPAPAVAQLLEGPLSAENAVRIALLNNPDLQTTLGSDGINITDLAPPNTPVQRRVTVQITRLSLETRKAWLTAVASAQTVEALSRLKDTAEASGELARRMKQAGNWSRLQQARQQVFVVEAASELVRAKEASFRAREKLVVLLGLWGAQAQFTLAAQLPALPAQARELPDVETQAMQAHEEIQLARQEWQRQEKERRITQPKQRWDALHDAAQLHALAVQARSQAREAYQRYRSRHELALYLETELLPLRQLISDEMLLRYNGMLSSVFDVLADARAQSQAASSAIAARRDFWLAEADLQAVLAGGSPLTLGEGAASPATSSAAAASH